MVIGCTNTIHPSKSLKPRNTVFLICTLHLILSKPKKYT